MTNYPNITGPVVGIRNGIRVAQLASRVLDIAERHRNTIVINSSNLIPVITGIVVDIGHAVDAVEVVFSWAGVGDNMPFGPRTIADGSDGGAGVGSGQVGNLARVSNVKIVILTKGRVN